MAIQQLSAAQTLLGISPNSSSNNIHIESFIYENSEPPIDSKTARPGHWDTSLKEERRIPVDSNRSSLDSLALLASSALNINSFSNSPSICMMPPPPPRSKGRIRSASNPEGMEKWDSFGNRCGSRRHFILPSSILEEELANANSACEAHNYFVKQHDQAYSASRPLKKRNFHIHHQDDPNEVQDDKSEIGNEKVTLPVVIDKSGPIILKNENTSFINSMTKRREEDYRISPTALLKRTRLRLLEDISPEPGSEKGELILPHSHDKYKEIYNKKGRIGMYTPVERAAIISKFNSKRSRRIWNKKIRYNCRKNLADRRLRVKGRFVKRTKEQIQSPNILANKEVSATMSTATEIEGSESPRGSVSSSLSQSPISILPVSGPLITIEEDLDSDLRETSCIKDVDMVDVTDPEAGFTPTKAQPFRRLRRHTIT